MRNQIADVMQTGILVIFRPADMRAVPDMSEATNVVLHCGRHGVPRLSQQSQQLMSADSIVDAKPWMVRGAQGRQIGGFVNAVVATLASNNTRFASMSGVPKKQAIMLCTAAHMYYWGNKLKAELVALVEQLKESDCTSQTTIGIKRMIVKTQDCGLTAEELELVADLVIYNILYPVWKAKMSVIHTASDCVSEVMVFRAAPAPLGEERSFEAATTRTSVGAWGRS